MEGQWSCYGGGQLEEEWSCYRGGHFNGGRMVMLQMGEWSCYGGRQFKGGRITVTVVAGLMVKLQRWSV